MQTLSEEFKKVPFVKIVIPFIAGVSFQIFYHPDDSIGLWLVLLSLIILSIISILKISSNYRFGFSWGIAFSITIFSLGIFFTQVQTTQLEFPHDVLKAKSIIVEINDLPVKTSKIWKTSASILYYKLDKCWKKCDVQCKLNIALDATAFNIKATDRYLVNAAPNLIDGPLSPCQFDFRQYLFYKGYQLQIYCKENKCLRLKVENSGFTNSLLKLREFLVNKIVNKSIKPREQSILSSLVLGFTGDIDPELRNAYAVAGVMHILSVSGMHVGIVYGFLMYLLFFMNKTPKLQILRSTIVIVCIWFYAIITGFSPPVIRSAAMFSFFAIGQSLNRDNNNFNTLAASAFFILLCNPFQLADMGFQLSYCAMAGIFLFYKPIYNAWTLKNGFYDKIWALISVSIAAQLGTLPLTLYYFHQFPTYFLLTNLFIVPLSGLIIYAGLVLLIFSFWSFAATIIATVLNYLLFILNWLILHVEFLPGASIHGIWINIFETTCLLLMVLTMAIWIFNKNNKLIFIFLGVALALITSNAIRVFSDSHQNSLVVYNTPGHITLSFIQNNKLVLFADSSIIRNVEKASSNLIIANNIEKVYYYKNYNNGFRDTSFADVHIHWFAGKNLLLSFNNNKIVIIRDRKLFSYSCKKPQLVDYLFISEKLNSTFQDFDEYFKPEFIVIERSRKQKILANSGLVKKLKTQVIFIDQQGAFKADL